MNYENKTLEPEQEDRRGTLPESLQAEDAFDSTGDRRI